jgi:peptide deformylase
MPTEILVEKTKLKKPPLKVHHLGDRVLRQAAKRVAKVDDSIRDLIRQMLQTMYSADGIGLAAPQVAVNKQVLVVDIDPEEASTEPLILINPTIKASGGEVIAFEEGCLSIPGVFLDVKRPEAIKLAYRDEMGRPQTLMADGMISRVVQHEIDHLNGVLFVDRVENKLALNQELSKQGFVASAVRSLV